MVLPPWLKPDFYTVSYFKVQVTKAHYNLKVNCARPGIGLRCLAEVPAWHWLLVKKWNVLFLSTVLSPWGWGGWSRLSASCTDSRGSHDSYLVSLRPRLCSCYLDWFRSKTYAYLTNKVYQALSKTPGVVLSCSLHMSVISDPRQKSVPDVVLQRGTTETCAQPLPTPFWVMSFGHEVLSVLL